MATALSYIREIYNGYCIGSGRQAEVYALRYPLSDFVIRIRHDEGEVIQQLTDSTVLSSLPNLFNGRNFGQPIFSGSGISVNLRAGDSLSEVFRANIIHYEALSLRRDVAVNKAYNEILDYILGMPDSVFRKIFLDINFLRERKRGIDCIGDNLVLNDGYRLGFIDTDGSLEDVKPDVDKVHHMLTSFDAGVHPIPVRFKIKLEAIRERLESAFRDVNERDELVAKPIWTDKVPNKKMKLGWVSHLSLL